MKTRATIGTALLLLVGLAAANAAQERGFVKLVNGRDLEGFQSVGDSRCDCTARSRRRTVQRAGIARKP